MQPVKESVPTKTKRPRNPWGHESYADMITRAIMSSFQQELSVKEIFEWFQDNIPYFAAQSSQDKNKTWKNTIRQNLSSLNRFQRIANPYSKRGSLWIINEDQDLVCKKKHPKEPNVDCRDGEPLGRKRGRPRSAKLTNDARPNLHSHVVDWMGQAASLVQSPQPTTEQLMNPSLHSLPQIAAALNTTHTLQSVKHANDFGIEAAIATSGPINKSASHLFDTLTNELPPSDSSAWRLPRFSSTNPPIKRKPFLKQRIVGKFDDRRFRNWIE